MSCVPGCLCFNDVGVDLEEPDAVCLCGHKLAVHKPAALFCMTTYACTCRVGRYEGFAFKKGRCKDPACGHPRSRHHDKLPAALAGVAHSINAEAIQTALARIMVQDEQDQDQEDEEETATGTTSLEAKEKDSRLDSALDAAVSKAIEQHPDVFEISRECAYARLEPSRALHGRP